MNHKVDVKLGQTSRSASIKINDVDITSVLNEVTVISKATDLTKLILGVSHLGREGVIEVDGEAYVEITMRNGRRFVLKEIHES